MNFNPISLQPDLLSKQVANIVQQADGKVVFLNLQSKRFPHRGLDFSRELDETLKRNPNIKVVWDGFNPMLQDKTVKLADMSVSIRDCYFDKEEKKVVYPEEMSGLVDMTLISVFYDYQKNELRKKSALKAMELWFKQAHLPRQIIFMELGFNGVFTFSQADFPPWVDYMRIDGTDAHKYLFQKEHLWNIAAKKSKYEKLMFIDSDIAPEEDVDWFQQVYDSLDRCLFTQGFRKITYLKDDGTPQFKSKYTFTSSIIHNKKGVDASNSVPGGVYCICKTTLEMVDGFSNHPVGGGDALWWWDTFQLCTDWSRVWLKLYERPQVRKILMSLHSIQKKYIIDEVPVDLVHFYHGELQNRSYVQRHYLLLSQYPMEGRLITEDEIGLLKWIESDNYFYKVLGRFQYINNNVYAAAKLMEGHMDYLNFVKYVKKLQEHNYTKEQILEYVKKLQERFKIEPKKGAKTK